MSTKCTSGTTAAMLENMRAEGQQSRADYIDGMQQELDRLQAENAELKRHRELLGKAIGDAAVTAGICSEDVPGLTGPQLLMLADDMACCIRDAQKQNERGNAALAERCQIVPVAVVRELLDNNEARIEWMFNPVPEGGVLQWDHGGVLDPEPSAAIFPKEKN